MADTFSTDIESALYQMLNTYAIANENGVSTPVPAFYSSPEAEIQVETHPSIVFYQSGMTPDPTRATNDVLYSDVITDVNGNQTGVSLRDDADPMVLFYDIRIYTLYEQDSKLLEKKIMTTFPWRGTLLVNGVKLDMIFQKRIDLTKGPMSLNASAMKILEKAPQREQVIALRYKINTSFDTHQPVAYDLNQQPPVFNVNPM